MRVLPFAGHRFFAELIFCGCLVCVCVRVCVGRRGKHAATWKVPDLLVPPPHNIYGTFVCVFCMQMSMCEVRIYCAAQVFLGVMAVTLLPFGVYIFHEIG